MESQDNDAPTLRGVDVIKDNLKRLPGRPGVYRMFGDGGEVLYVGKARDLKARVGNYARLGGHTQRIARMISMTRRMEFVVTESFAERATLSALLLNRLADGRMDGPRIKAMMEN